MGALADCEALAGEFIGQPVNTITTLAFVVVGAIVIARRPDRRWVGWGLIATGFGSFLFHGPMPPAAEWTHDVTLAWLIALVGASDEPFEGLSRLPGLALLAVAFWLFPTAADPLAVGLTVIAVILILRRDRTSSALFPLLLLGVAAVLGRLGATGGPLCDPDSLFQAHGVWHMASAVAVGWWALASETTAPTRESVAED